MKKILVVDDNKDILQVVELVLEIRGYAVKVVWQGEKTLQAAKEFVPDLILLDVLLGTTSGIEICHEIKANPDTKNICVIMFSAHANRNDVLKLCPADGFISKPFDVHDLTGVIQTHLDRCDLKD